MKCAGLLLLTCIAAGCSSFGSVDDDSRATIRRMYSVEPQTKWARLSRREHDLWTVDGPILQAIRFFDPVEDGDALLRVRDPEEVPEFRASMTAVEIEEFVIDSLVAAGVANVQTSGLRPAPFGELDGFGFDLEYLDENGLEFRGLARGVVDDSKLYLVLYTGTRAHYFTAHEDDAKRILTSLQFLER